MPSGKFREVLRAKIDSRHVQVTMPHSMQVIERDPSVYDRSFVHTCSGSACLLDDNMYVSTTICHFDVSNATFLLGCIATMQHFSRHVLSSARCLSALNAPLFSKQLTYAISFISLSGHHDNGSLLRTAFRARVNHCQWHCLAKPKNIS